MRIQCPHCGERGLSEFSYLGDASFTRPSASAADAQSQFVDAVYLRDNPSGWHRELWYHSAGCRSWLRVKRNTRTHEILEVSFAHPAAGS